MPYTSITDAKNQDCAHCCYRSGRLDRACVIRKGGSYTVRLLDCTSVIIGRAESKWHPVPAFTQRLNHSSRVVQRFGPRKHGAAHDTIPYHPQKATKTCTQVDVWCTPTQQETPPKKQQPKSPCLPPPICTTHSTL